MPGWCSSKMNTESPRCLGTSQFVRISARPQSDHHAPVVQILEPLMIHSSPSRTAEVCAPATSEPPDGSERSCIQISSPLKIFGKCSFFCSSVPNSSSTDAHGWKVGTWMRAEYEYPVSSSLNATWWSTVNPCPSYSFGKQIPAKPAS